MLGGARNGLRLFRCDTAASLPPPYRVEIFLWRVPPQAALIKLFSFLGSFQYSEDSALSL